MMMLMGTAAATTPPPKHKQVGFEDVLGARHNRNVVLLNTLPLDEQDALIVGTLRAQDEERVINGFLDAGTQAAVTVIVYGRNSVDESVATKLSQIEALGFTQARAYLGGMFEWLLLRDYFGKDTIPLVSNQAEKNILSYKPDRLLNFN